VSDSEREGATGDSEAPPACQPRREPRPKQRRAAGSWCEQDGSALRPLRFPKASVFQGMAILACFSPERRSLTAGEIAETINLASATVQERLDTLVRCGYLDPGRSGAYRLAERLPKDLLLSCS
jgi:hypothetical protein